MSAATCFMLVATTVLILVPPPVVAAQSSDSTQVFAAQSASKAPSSGDPANAVGPTKPAPTEILARRTQYSRTFDNHDGTFRTEIAAAPMHYRSGSQWLPVNYNFVASSDGRHLNANRSSVPIEVNTPEDPAGFLVVHSNGKTIRLRLAPGAQPGKPDSKPIVDPAEANIHGLLPNVDLRVFAGANGASTFLILQARPTDPNFTFELDSPGLTPTLLADGRIEFRDKSGNLVATMPRPYAVDSTKDEARGGGQMTDKVSYSLSSQGSKTLLSVSVDQAWLDAATYPAYVDPTIQGTTAVTDNFVSGKYPSSVFADYSRPDSPYYHELWLGMDPTDSTNVNNDYLRFDLSSVSGTIQSATLQVLPYHQYSAAPNSTATWVRRVSAPWSASELVWTNQPATTALTSAELVEGSWGSFTVTSTVQDWIDSPTTNYGFMLWEDNNGAAYWKRLISSEDPSGNGPKLVVTFAPPVADNLAPAGNAWTNDRTLSWNYSSPVGFAQVAYAITLADNSSFTSPLISTGNVATSATSYEIPTGTALANGETYYWKVKVTDSDGATFETGAAPFRWDGVAPSAPVITAPGAPVLQSPSSYTFTWTVPSDTSGISGYEVTPQETPISAPGVCGTSWTDIPSASVTSASYTPTGLSTAKCYRVSVKATDNGGNMSASSSYSEPVLVDTASAENWDAPDVVASGTNVYQATANDPVYVKASVSGTVSLTQTVSTPPSGLVCIQTENPSPLSGGWEPNPPQTELPWCDPSSPFQAFLRWSANPASSTIAVKAKNAANAWSATRVVSLIPDAGPTLTFTTPDPFATSVHTDGTFDLAWSEISASGVVSRTLTRYSGPAPDGYTSTCTGGWTAEETTAAGASPLAVSGLANDHCYYWVLTLTDHVGNVVEFTSGQLIIDTSAPDTWPAPDVVVSGAGISQASPNAPAYFKAGTSGTATLTATASRPPSGITCVQFSSLTAETGWTPGPQLPNCPTAEPYTQDLTYDATAVATTINVTATNGAGVSTLPRPVSLIPDALPPVADFSWPQEGTTTVTSDGGGSVTWVELDEAAPGTPGSGSTRSLQRQRATIVTPGSCDGVTWVNDGSPTTGPGPVSQGLLSGYCYRWALTLTDLVGNTTATPFYSGAILRDGLQPGLSTSNLTEYFVSDWAGSLTFSLQGSDPESGIESISISALSSSEGWTFDSPGPGTYPSGMITVTLSHAAGAGQTSFTITVRNNAGLELAYPWTLRPDSTMPTADFLTPNEGTTTIVASTSYLVSWNASDPESGTWPWGFLTPFRGVVVTPGSCAGVTYEQGNYAFSFSPKAFDGLLPGYCYKWKLALQDKVGHYLEAWSGMVLIDPTAPAQTSISLSGDPGSSWRSGDTIFFRPSAAGTMTLTAASFDNESAIDHFTFSSLSAPAGWTYTPGAGTEKQLTWTAQAAATSLEVTATNGAGTSSEAVTIYLVPDSTAPSAVFSSPAAGQTVIQVSPNYTVEWTEDDTGSGVASRSMQRQSGDVVAGACEGVSWTDDGSPTTAVTPLAVDGLPANHCYRWVLTIIDQLGNSASYTSGSVLVGTDSPCAPDISASGSGVFQAGPNEPIYFNLYGSGSISISAAVPCTPTSGVASVDYGTLSVSTGWTANRSLPSSAPYSPYQQVLVPGVGAQSTTLAATSRTNQGAVSDPRTISIVADADPPTADFAMPDEGADLLQASTEFVVSWSDTDNFGSPGSGVHSRVRQRLVAAPVDGVCPTYEAAWQADGGPDADPISGTVQTLTSGQCYRWRLTLTDHVGNSASYLSGIVQVDSTPLPPDVTASGQGAYQASPNSTVYVRADGSSTATLTATSSSPHVANITFGELTAAAGWSSDPTLPNQTTSTPPTQGLTASSGAGATNISVIATTSTGLESSPRVVPLVPDKTAPVVEFVSPSASTTLQASRSVTVSWTEADSGSGVASRSLQRRTSPAYAGVCVLPVYAVWQDDGPPDPTFVSGSTVNGLLDDHCYEWMVSVTDHAGNQASYTSGPVLIDSSAWAAASVEASGFQVYQASENLAYFRPAMSGDPIPLRLGATVPMPPSGLVDITFGSLTSPEGWGADPALPASMSGITQLYLYRSTTAAETSIQIVAHNGVGAASVPRLFTVRPDASSPVAEFTSPVTGSSQASASSSLTVGWTQADSGSGIESYSLQRRRAAVATGSCTGLTFEEDGSPRTGELPGSSETVAESGLESGFCYQWTLTLHDRVGNAATFMSGVVLVDLLAPALAFTTPASGDALITSQSDYSVVWTETEGESGIASRSLQRQITAIGPDGVCASSGWADDGPASSDPAPRAGFDLALDHCYRWVLSVDDVAGNSASSLSGTIAVTRIELDFPSPSWQLFAIESLHATVLPSEEPTRIDFLVDGVVQGSVLEEPFTLQLDTTSLIDGPHAFQAVLVSEAGSWTAPPISVNVANLLSPLERVEADYAAGRIGLSQKVLLGTYAWGASDLNPPRYRSATYNKEDVLSPDSTGASEDVIAAVTEFHNQPLRGALYVSWVTDPKYEYDPASQPPQAPDPCVTATSTFVDRPYANVRYYFELILGGGRTNGNQCVLETPHFNLHYAIRGYPGSALDWTADRLDFVSDQNGFRLTSGANGLPDQIDVHAVLLEQARAFYSAPMAHPDQPIPSTGLSEGGLGFWVPDRFTEVSVVKGGGSVDRNPWSWIMRLDETTDFALATHELFHVVQGGYSDSLQGDPWREETAEWAAGRFAAMHLEYWPAQKASPGFPNGIWPGLVSQKEPWYNVGGYTWDPSADVTGVHGYERMMFPEFITEHYRADFVLKSFEDRGLFQSARAAVLHNAWMPEAFANFALANYLLHADRSQFPSILQYTHSLAYDNPSYDPIRSMQYHAREQWVAGNPKAPAPSYIKRDQPTQWQDGRLSGRAAPDGLGVKYVDILVPPNGASVVPTVEMLLTFRITGASEADAKYQVGIVSDDYGNNGHVCDVLPTLNAPAFTPGPDGRDEASATVSISPTCPRVALVITHLSTTGTLDWTADLNGYVSGYVKDALTGQAIAGASVASGGNTVASDVTGAYRLALETGQNEINASASGHADGMAIVTVTGGEEVTHDFFLSRPAPGIWFRGLTPYLGGTGSPYVLPPAALWTKAQQVAASPSGQVKAVAGVYRSPDGSDSGYIAPDGFWQPTLLPGTTNIGSLSVVSGQRWDPSTYTMEDQEMAAMYASGTDAAGAYVAGFDPAALGGFNPEAMPEVWRQYPVGGTGTGPALSSPAGLGSAYFATDTSGNGMFLGLADSVGVQAFPVPSGSHVGKIVSSADGQMVYVSIQNRTSGIWSIRRYGSDGTLDNSFSWTAANVADFAVDPSDEALYVVTSSPPIQLCKYTNGQETWCRYLPDVNGFNGETFRALGASNGHAYLASLIGATNSFGQATQQIDVTIVDGSDGYALKHISSGEGADEYGFVDTSTEILSMSVANDEVYVVGTTNPLTFRLQWLIKQLSSGMPWLSLLAVRPYGYGAWFTDMTDG